MRSCILLIQRKVHAAIATVDHKTWCSVMTMGSGASIVVYNALSVKPIARQLYVRIAWIPQQDVSDVVKEVLIVKKTSTIIALFA